MSEVMALTSAGITQQYTEAAVDDRQDMIQLLFNEILRELVPCSMDVFLKRFMELELVIRKWSHVDDPMDVKSSTEPELWDIESPPPASAEDASSSCFASAAALDCGDLRLEVALEQSDDPSPLPSADEIASDEYFAIREEVKVEPSDSDSYQVPTSTNCVATNLATGVVPSTQRHRGRPRKSTKDAVDKRKNQKRTGSVLPAATAETASSSASIDDQQDNNSVRMKRKCQVCGERFAALKLLRDHIAEVHLSSCHRELMQRPRCRRRGKQPAAVSSSSSSNSSSSSSSLVKFECEQCGVTLSSLGSLRRHVIDQHSDAKPQYKCETCGYAMSCASSLSRHRKLMHKQSRPHTCDVCGKAFALRQTLKQHQIGVHMKIRSHLCPFCGSQFLKRDNLRTHLIHVHKDKYHPT